MASVDERVVAISFENSTFEARVAHTQVTLGKLNSTLANIGKVNGLNDIEKAASKVTLHGPMSALDRLKVKLGGASHGAAEGFSGIDRAANKVSLTGPATALDKLRSRLSTVSVGAAEGFGGIERAANHVSLDGITHAVDGLSSKFTALKVTGAAALATIASGLTRRAGALGKALTLTPVIDGFKEYTTNLRSIQTILANTEQAGTKLKDVQAALRQLNKYSDQTIYNFGQMADAVGLFTAAGVDLETSVASIKGIANLTALGGKNMEEARSAMVQLSQAVSSGKVDLQTWNTLVNAGIAGPKFQQGLTRNAIAMGTLSNGVVKTTDKMGNLTIKGESFRESIMSKPGEKSWLTSKVLTETLKQFTGDMSDAELKAKGFNASQIKAIQQSAKAAKEAATQVKDLKGVFDVTKEAIGSGWSETFKLIFGDFNEAKKTFTGLAESIQGVVSDSADARNKVLEDFGKMGGRKVAIEGIKNAFEALMSVLKPVKEAFRDIFPAKTGKDLFDLAVRFRDFMKSLKIGPETADKLRRTFAGIFAVLHIGIAIVKGVFKVIGKLLGLVGQGSGTFLGITASIGDFLVALDKAITKGGALSAFFEGLGGIIRIPIELLKALGRIISGLFGGNTDGNADKFSKSMDGVKKSLGPLAGILDTAGKAWDKLSKILEKVKEVTAPILDKIGDLFNNIGDFIANAITNMDFDKITSAINTTLLGGIFLAIKKGIGINVKNNFDLGGGLLTKLGKTFEALTGSLTAMQKNIQANTLLQIGAAIGVLALGVKVLSTIEPKKLAKAMTAVSVGLGQLTAAVALLSKFSGSGVTLPFIALGIIGIATAMIILGGAMKIFATMSWDEIGKGLTGVAGGLVAVGLGVKLIGPEIIPAAAGIGLLALGLTALAVAVKIFGEMDLKELGQGLIGVATALVSIGLAMKLMPPNMLITAAGIGILAGAMIVLSGAVRSFGSMKLAELAKGILGAAAAIVALGLATAAIPPGLALRAAGLVVLGLALNGVATAVGILGRMKIGTLVKGIAGLGATLGILAIGLTAMSRTFLGSLALLAAAGALAILAPTLFIFGKMPWKVILRGLAAMALTIGVLAGAGALAAPALVALGGALAALGLGMSLVAASVWILAKGLVLLGSEGTKGIAVMIAAMTAFIAVFPKMVINFIKGVVEILAQIAVLAPKVVDSVVKIVESILEAVIRSAPKMSVAAGSLILAFLKVLNDNAGPLIKAGWRLLLNFLSGIRDNIFHVVAIAADIVVKFLRSLAEKMPSLFAAGAHLLIKFLQGVTAELPKVLANAARLVGTFILGITQKLPGLIQKGGELLRTFLLGIARAIPRVAPAAIRVIVAFLKGLGDGIPKIVPMGVRIIRKLIIALGDAAPRLTDAGAKAIIKFMNGIARAIRDNDDKMGRAGGNIATAIVEGLVHGLAALGWKVAEAAGKLALAIPKKIFKVMGIHSPSTVMMNIGGLMVAGLVKGLEDNSSSAANAAGGMADDVVGTTENILKQVPALLDGLVDMDPVITPVMDLTNIERDAQRIADLTKVVPITAAASFGQAAAISDQQAAAQTAEEVQSDAPVQALNFEQNNYSPESLSDITIYRQTRNQLSQVKSALGL